MQKISLSNDLVEGKRKNPGISSCCHLLWQFPRDGWQCPDPKMHQPAHGWRVWRRRGRSWLAQPLGMGFLPAGAGAPSQPHHPRAGSPKLAQNLPHATFASWSLASLGGLWRSWGFLGFSWALRQSKGRGAESGWGLFPPSWIPLPAVSSQLGLGMGQMA